MRKIYRNKWLAMCLPIITAILVFIACEDATDPDQEWPDIPPISTFYLNPSGFVSGDTTTFAKPAEIASHVNWGWAALNVVGWNTFIFVGLAVPVICYTASFDHTPERQEDGSWLWTYDFDVLGSTFTAELYATTGLNSIEWEMYLSRAGYYEDFLWYSGEHDILVTEGSWRLNEIHDNDIDSTNQLLDINWTRSIDGETFETRYTNIKPGSDDSTSFIYYGVTDDTDYDAFYRVFLTDDMRYLDIDFNSTTEAGRVMDSLFFEDDEWHCWDSTLADIECQ